MPVSRKSLAYPAAGAALLAGAFAFWSTGPAVGDDEDAVEAVEVGRLTDAPAGDDGDDRGEGPSGSTTSTTAADLAVPGLTELSGPVTQAPDDDGFDDLVVEGLELDFGPDEWSATVGPTQDFDRDGRTEALRDEIAGLRGTESTFAVQVDDDGDEAHVFLVNGLTYRDPAGPAPWGAADDGSGGGSGGADDSGGDAGDSGDSGDDHGGDVDRDDRVEPGDDRD